MTQAQDLTTLLGLGCACAGPAPADAELDPLAAALSVFDKAMAEPPLPVLNDAGGLSGLEAVFAHMQPRAPAQAHLQSMPINAWGTLQWALSKPAVPAGTRVWVESRDSRGNYTIRVGQKSTTVVVVDAVRLDQSARALHGLPEGLGVLPAASLVTVGAAKALDAQLATSGAAGCSDLKSTLRQLTFAFKAAFLTDPVTQNTPEAAALNMATPLAMTGFGPGTNAALSYVMRSDRTYIGTEVTDSSGNCLGGVALPELPAALQPLIAKVLEQVSLAIKNATAATQGGVLANLQAIVNQLLTQLAVANVQPMPQLPAAPPAATSTTTVVNPPAAPAKPFPTGTVIVGGVIGVAVLGTVVYFVHREMQRRHAA